MKVMKILDYDNRRQMIYYHRQLWDWLFQNPMEQKEDWPRWKRNGGDIREVMCLCFACVYDTRHKQACDSCLFDWVITKDCTDKRGYFVRWVKAKTAKTKKKYAAIIRDLKVRRNA